jgi:hypothetical protein
MPVLAFRWIGDLVALLAAGIKSAELKADRMDPGSACRNRAATGKLSAHAEELAIDIVGFELANGSALRIKSDAGAAHVPALAAPRTGACR